MSNYYEEIKPEDIRDLIERELPPNPCWIEPGVLPKRGKLLYGGTSKIGKSLAMLSMARALVTGGHPFECPKLVVPTPVNVLFVEQELGPWILQSHCRKIFDPSDTDYARDKRVRYLSQVRKFRLDEPDCVPALTGWIQETDTNVLFLDPISKMHSYDENAAKEMGFMFERLDRVLDNCKGQNLSIVYSHHFGKPQRDSSRDYDRHDFNNFRGSTRFHNDPDTIITVCRRADWKTNEGHRAWLLTTGWTCRAAEPPFESGQPFHVNEDGRLRVRYVHDHEGPPVSADGPTGASLPLMKGMYRGKS